MKYKHPFNPNHKPYHNYFQAPYQSNPQPFPKPSENPPAYKPNISTPNHTSESPENPKSEKPKIICHKCGHENHYAQDCLAEAPQKPKIKDSTYYACRAQEMAASEKTFVITVSEMWKDIGHLEMKMM